MALQLLFVTDIEAPDRVCVPFYRCVIVGLPGNVHANVQPLIAVPVLFWIITLAVDSPFTSRHLPPFRLTVVQAVRHEFPLWQIMPEPEPSHWTSGLQKVATAVAGWEEMRRKISVKQISVISAKRVLVDRSYDAVPIGGSTPFRLTTPSAAARRTGEVLRNRYLQLDYNLLSPWVYWIWA
jgi:hypothetical protein